MDMLVKRKYLTDNTTIGELYINNVFECYTLEDKDRDLLGSMTTGEIQQKKIFSKTAIPRGTYPVLVTATGITSNVGQKNGMLPLVNNVRGFSGIRIHVGNNATHTEGCLLLGTSKANDTIGGSTAAVNAAFTKILNAINAGQSVSITYVLDLTGGFDKRTADNSTPASQGSGNSNGNSGGSGSAQLPNSQDVNGNNSVTGASGQGGNNIGDMEGLTSNFNQTFEQINRNVSNLEAGDVDVTWGKGLTGDDSDWIGLKQFLIYLGTRYTPQSVFPFVELIPVSKVESSENVDADKEKFSHGENPYIRDGKIPKDVESQLGGSKSKEDKKTLDRLKFITELPPGYNEEKFNTGAKASNEASGTADLFSLDPFKEGLEFLGEMSSSGKKVFEQRNIGVRAYGQLVLNPSSIEGVPSKPGAIGFTSLEIQAGSQSDNGLALISMELKDIQGNKFTDINSPWAFIYDVRPGSAGGDFFFRYGWQIRLPMPNDNADISAKRFWSHEGWKLFPESVKKAIQNQLQPGKQYITLTQSLNDGPSDDSTTEGNQPPSERLALFDEGIDFDATSGKVKVSRSLVEDNYVRISILNPEMSLDENGVATAKLTFRTTGAITKLIPITYAITTRKLLGLDKKINLGDLLLAVEDDSAKFGFLFLDGKEQKLKKEKYRSQLTFRSATQDNRRFPNVFIIGPESGGMTGTIHPDDIAITIPKKMRNQMLNPGKENDLTLIRWFRQVLQENECELSSAATGSGAGINAAWIITTTQKINQSKANIRKVNSEANDPNAELLNFMKSEKDVFAYRFQGSLVESMTVEKTDSPNALKIQADFTVGDLADSDSESKDEKDSLQEINKPITADDRKRNLTVIFSQMQNITLQAICHPWMGPGKRFWVKGMGFYDGEYLCLQVTHKLDHHKFTTQIQGARMLVNDEQEKDRELKENAAANGNNNFSKQTTKQQANETPVKSKPAANSTQPAKPLDQNGFLLTLEQLTQISKKKNKKTLESVIGPLNDTMKKYQINTSLRICHFLAQVMHESGEFSWYREFASGAAYEGRADLGNTQTGDGVKYKGRGAIQITGRANYQKVTDSFGVDFINNPVWLEQINYGTQAAGWYWDRRHLNTYADQDDLREVTRRVNGGTNGLTDRAYYLQQAKVVLIGKA